MPRNEQIICPANRNHLYSNQNGSDYDGMHTIDADRVHTVKPAEWTPVFVCEARVRAQLGNSSSGFDPAKDVSLGQVLMLYRDGRLAIDAGIAELPKDDCRKPQPLSGQQLAAILFCDLLVMTPS
jgi:hypothetical protein